MRTCSSLQVIRPIRFQQCIPSEIVVLSSLNVSHRSLRSRQTSLPIKVLREVNVASKWATKTNRGQREILSRAANCCYFYSKEILASRFVCDGDTSARSVKRKQFPRDRLRQSSDVMKYKRWYKTRKQMYGLKRSRWYFVKDDRPDK